MGFFSINFVLTIILYLHYIYTTNKDKLWVKTDTHFIPKNISHVFLHQKMCFVSIMVTNLIFHVFEFRVSKLPLAKAKMDISLDIPER